MRSSVRITWFHVIGNGDRINDKAKGLLKFSLHDSELPKKIDRGNRE
jgi:hypothetical protein